MGSRREWILFDQIRSDRPRSEFELHARLAEGSDNQQLPCKRPRFVDCCWYGAPLSRCCSGQSISSSPGKSSNERRIKTMVGTRSTFVNVSRLWTGLASLVRIYFSKFGQRAELELTAATELLISQSSTAASSTDKPSSLK